MSLLLLPDDSCVKETLEAVLEESEDLKAVVVLTLDRYQCQAMTTSNMSPMQMSYLLAYFQTHFAQHFFSEEA